MGQGEKKTGKELAEVLNKLKDDEEIDVLIYVKQPATGFDDYLQIKQEKGELKYNFLEFANCYVVEASKRLLLEIADHEDVSKMEVNPRFGVQ